MNTVPVPVPVSTKIAVFLARTGVYISCCGA